MEQQSGNPLIFSILGSILGSYLICLPFCDSSLLQAGHDFPYNSITSALQRFNLQAKLMKLDEPLSNLSQVERQLLCLAKCWLTMPAVSIFNFIILFRNQYRFFYRF